MVNFEKGEPTNGMAFGLKTKHYPACPFFIPYMDFSGYTNQGKCGHPMVKKYAGDKTSCEYMNTVHSDIPCRCPIENMRGTQITEEEEYIIYVAIRKIKKFVETENKNKTQVKYVFTGDEKVYRNHVLHRIQAIEDFGTIKEGEIGGWIESEENLSRKDTCWVADDAMVFGNACIHHYAYVCGKAKVYGNAHLWGNVFVGENARVYDDASLNYEAIVDGNAKIHGKANLYDRVHFGGTSEARHRVYIYGNCEATDGLIQSFNGDYNLHETHVYHHIFERERANAAANAVKREIERVIKHQKELKELGRFGGLDITSKGKIKGKKPTKRTVANARFEGI
jgi:carbonic anhydrase/acetyltransferase-like protein (isoleucine patch superfamily)